MNISSIFQVAIALYSYYKMMLDNIKMNVVFSNICFTCVKVYLEESKVQENLTSFVKTGIIYLYITTICKVNLK